MRLRRWSGVVLGWALFAALVAAAPARAVAQEPQKPDSVRIAELERQIETITRELEEMRLGQDLVVQADTSVYGFGPAASKVYRVRQGVSIGGYGEMMYENFGAERENGTPSGKRDRIDFLRAIIYIGYKFGDKFLFNSEIEFEHGTTDQGGSVSVEFAYLDYLLSPQFGLRAGMLLPPMGFVNELHEPPIFLGTTRPETERQIIPSTWRENGIGFFGEAGGFAYRAYVVNGFNGLGFGASGLRGGRQKGAIALAEDFGAVARVDYVGTLGLWVGTSAYVGNSGQSDSIGARTILWEGHAQYKAYGFDVRGLFALATVDDVEALNAAKGIAPGSNASIGERLVGGYVQLGYDVLRRSGTTHQLIPYVRYEMLNTQEAVPAGFAANPENDRRIVSLGAAWKPIPNISVKADYEIHRNEAKTGVDQINVNVGYLF